MTTTTSEPIKCQTGSYGTLEIDNVSLHTPAWCAVDLSELWGTPEYRGEDVLIPHKTGRRPYLRRKDATRYSLPMMVTGYCDQFGAVNANYDIGLQENVEYLMTYVALPTNTGDGTRTAEWTLPSGTVVTAQIHVLGLRGQLLPGALYRPTLEISVPGADLHLGAA